MANNKFSNACYLPSVVDSVELPSFRYHQDPVATGFVKRSDQRCLCCGKARGFIYVGPVYAEEELDECICPWCIADGSAAKKWDALFTDDAGIGEGDDWDTVSPRVVEEVTLRTPGFAAWQQERWWTHCNDAANFIGLARTQELLQYGPDTLQRLRSELGDPDDASFQKLINALDTKGMSPLACLFRCNHCAEVGGYIDFP